MTRLRGLFVVVSLVVGCARGAGEPNDEPWTPISKGKGGEAGAGGEGGAAGSGQSAGAEAGGSSAAGKAASGGKGGGGKAAAGADAGGAGGESGGQGGEASGGKAQGGEAQGGAGGGDGGGDQGGMGGDAAAGQGGGEQAGMGGVAQGGAGQGGAGQGGAGAGGAGAAGASGGAAAGAAGAGGAAGGSGSAGSAGSAGKGGSTGAGGAACGVTHLIISEIQVKGSLGDLDDFIELFNPTSEPVTLDATWRLQVRDQTTLQFADRWVGGGDVIEPYSHYLLTNQSATNTHYDGPVPGDAKISPGIPVAGSVILKKGVDVIDGICFRPDTASFANYNFAGLLCEGNPVLGPDLSAAFPPDSSFRRKAVGSAECADTGDNASDFEVSMAPTPENKASAATPP